MYKTVLKNSICFTLLIGLILFYFLKVTKNVYSIYFHFSVVNMTVSLSSRYRLGHNVPKRDSPLPIMTHINLPLPTFNKLCHSVGLVEVTFRSRWATLR